MRLFITKHIYVFVVKIEIMTKINKFNKRCFKIISYNILVVLKINKYFSVILFFI